MDKSISSVNTGNPPTIQQEYKREKQQEIEIYFAPALENCEDDEQKEMAMNYNTYLCY
jgi:hypothetical protein